MDFKKLFGAFVKSGADTGEGKPKGSKWAYSGKKRAK